MANTLPTWLSAPEPPMVEVPESDKKVLLALRFKEYESMFMNFLDQIARGASLHRLLEEDHRNVDYNDFYRWIKKDAKRYELFKEAQELRTEFMAAEILRIADAEDSMEDVNRSRLKIETRKFLMGAHNRKRYGETKQIEMNTSISIVDALAQANARLIEGEILSSHSDDNDAEA